MKNLYYWIALFAVTLTASSCHVRKDGEWTPIQLDKNELFFPREGGEDVVTALNYRGIAIDGGGEFDLIDGKWESHNNSPASSPNEFNGEWFCAIIPVEKTNTLIITVDENKSGKTRKAGISLRVGDAFNGVVFTQE